MLLRNAHVKVALRETPLKLDHARAFAHGRRDTHQPCILRSHITQPIAEDLRERGLGRSRRFLQTHRWIKLARAMVGHRVIFGALVTLALFGDHVQKLRTAEVLDVLQGRNQRIKVMPVDRADVVEAELLKQCSGNQHAFGLLFDALGQLKQGRRAFEQSLADVLGLGVKLPAHQLSEIPVERTDRRADAHVVVVQDDQQLALLHACVVQRLKGHTGG